MHAPFIDMLKLPQANTIKDQKLFKSRNGKPQGVFRHPHLHHTHFQTIYFLCTQCTATLAATRRVCFTHNISISASWSVCVFWSGCWAICYPFWTSLCLTVSHHATQLCPQVLPSFLRYFKKMGKQEFTYKLIQQMSMLQNILKWNYSFEYNRYIWSVVCGVEQTQCSVCAPVGPTSVTTDHLWMAVPSDGTPKWFPSTSLLSFLCLGAPHLTTASLSL